MQWLGVTVVVRNAQESAGKAAALRSGGTLSLSSVHDQHFPRSDVEFGMRAGEGWRGGLRMEAECVRILYILYVGVL